MDAPRLYRRPSVLASVVRGVVFKVTLTALAALVAWPVHEGPYVVRSQRRPALFVLTDGATPWDIEFLMGRSTGPVFVPIDESPPVTGTSEEWSSSSPPLPSSETVS